MSIIMVIQIACNGPECYEAWQSHPDDIDSAHRQRQAAKAAGWLVSQAGGRDYCPTCVAQSNIVIDVNW